MGVSTTGGGLYFDSAIDDSQFGAAINRMNGDVNKLTGNIKAQSSEIENYAKRAAAAATAFLSLQAFGGFIEKMVQIRGEFQQIEVAFTTMLKSKDASNKLMAQMVQLAATTPFTLEEVAKSGKQLLAYGFAADTITDTLTKLGDVAAGVSAPIGDISYLFGTLKTQGRAFTKDIREFSGRGIPIVAELAKVLKTSEANVNTLVESGKVGFPEVEKAFNNMTSSGGMFFNLMKEQSKTLTGRISNLSDAWDNMLNSLGKSQEGIFAGGIQAATDLVTNYENVLSIITVLTAGYGVYRAALIATAAVEKLGVTNAGNMVLALNAESVARIENAGAMLEELRANVVNLAAKKETAAQTLSADLAILASSKQRLAAAELSQASAGMDVLASTKVAKAKELQAAQEAVAAAKEQASISRKAAVAASTEFNAAVTELETTAKISNSAATVELTAVESLQVANKRILIAVTEAYNAVLAATPAAAFATVLTALGVAIYALTQTTNAAAVATKALNQVQTEVAGKFAEQSLTIQDYIKIIQDANSTENERATALKKLTELNPSILGALNAQNVSTREGSEAIKEYLKWLDAKLQGEAAYVIKSDAVKRIAERNLKAGLEGNELDKGLDWTTRLGYSLKNFFVKGRSFTSTQNESTDIVKQLNQQDQAVIDAVDKKYGAALKQRALDGMTPKDAKLPDVKNKAYYDAIIKKNTDDLEALDSGAKDFETRSKPLIAKIAAARKALLQFDATGKQDKKDAKDANIENAALKRQSEMLQKVYELNQKYSDKSLTDDEQKLAQIRADYKNLQADINIYNKDPKNKKINPNLKPQLEKAIENQDYENDTKNLATQLDKQKTLYADFEAYKVLFGEIKAKERFGQELKSTDDYIAQLEAKRAELLKTDPLNMTGTQKARLKLYDDNINELVNSQKKGLDQLLQDNLTYAQQRKLATEKYNAEFLKLQGNPEAQAQLTKNYTESIKQLDETNVEKLDSYKHLFDGFNRMSSESIKKYLLDAKLKADFDLKYGNITQEAYDKIVKGINDATEAVNSAIPDQLNKIGSIFKDLAVSTNGLSSGLTSALNILGDMTIAAGQIKGGIDDTKSAIANFSATKDASGGGLLGTLAGISSVAGPASKAIGAVVNVVKGVTNFFKASKESAAKAKAELQTYQDNLLKGEISYNEALRERARTLKDINDLSVKELLTQQSLLALQKTSAKSDYDRLLAQIRASGEQITGTHIEKSGGILGIGKKSTTVQDTAGVGNADYDQLEKLYLSGKLTDATKAWFEELKKAKDEADAIATATVDAQNALNEKLTGTTAASISDGIIQGFKDGKRTAEDFADDFKGYMSDAMYEALKDDFLDAAIADFYKKFAELSKDGLTDDETKDLQEQYQEIIAEGIKKASDIDLVTGNLGGKATTKTGVSGAVVGEALTEGTANRVLGISIAELDEIKRQGIADQAYYKLSVSHFSEIAANTLRTADNTELLKPMAADLKKLADNASDSDSTDLYQALRDGGVKNV